MSKLGALLVLFFLSLGLLNGAEELRQEDPEVPLSFLVFSGSNDLETEFGFEIVEAIRAERMRCDIKNRKEELKFISKQDRMMRYFRQAKQAIAFPEFKQLSKANKDDVMHNFKKAAEDIEISHFRKLNHMQAACDKIIQSFMEDRLKRVMNYATTLLRADRTKFTMFVFEMTEYQGQLQHGLGNCITYLEKNSETEHYERAGTYFDLCYGNEVVALIKFLTNFTSLAEDLTQQMDKTKVELIEPQVSKEPPTTKATEGTPTDLEDGDDHEVSGSGSGSEEANSKGKETVPPKTIESSKPEKPTLTDEKPVKTEPTKPAMTTKEEEKPVKTEPTKPAMTTKEEEKPTTESTLEIAEDFSKHLLPGPVVFDPKKDEKKPAPKPLSDVDSRIADEAYERVRKIQEAADKKDERPLRAKSRTPTEEKDPQLSIDLDLPEINAGVDVEIGPNGVQIDSQSGGEEIVFEEITTGTTHHNDHNGHSFKAMFFIYFFATLGILLAITLLVLIVIIVRVKTTKPSNSSKDTPLLSEQEKIAVMKQSGYVNPTYQFFDEVKEV